MAANNNLSRVFIEKSCYRQNCKGIYHFVVVFCGSGTARWHIWLSTPPNPSPVLFPHRSQHPSFVLVIGQSYMTSSRNTTSVLIAALIRVKYKRLQKTVALLNTTYIFYVTDIFLWGGGKGMNKGYELPRVIEWMGHSQVYTLLPLFSLPPPPRDNTVIGIISFSWKSWHWKDPKYI